MPSRSIEAASAIASGWPSLPLDAWRDTYATLHMWTQIVGKLSLALSPHVNHYWNAALHVTPRGLATQSLSFSGRALAITFDFVDHRLVVESSDGASAAIPLEPRTVAGFYGLVMEALHSIGVRARIWTKPQEVLEPVPFESDTIHHSYDAAAASACWLALVQMKRVLEEFRSGFVGKSSPVHFWWGSFDLAHTRFSGKRAPPHPGGVPNLSDRVTRESYSHECFSVGWWPGGGLTPVQEPSFYAYAYPEPPGCPEAVIRPTAAHYDLRLREWIFPYEAVRRADDPDAALLEFARSTYEATAELGAWDRVTLEP